MPTQDEVRNAYSDLYDALRNAFWAASSIEDKDLIHGLMEGVFEIKSTLNAADIRSRTTEYQQLTADVRAVNAKLQVLKDGIDKIVHNIKTASTVVNAASKALGVAADFIA